MIDSFNGHRFDALAVMSLNAVLITLGKSETVELRSTTD